MYSIKDIEKLTGVKAHTLRAWERRYNIVCPKRTDGNIRYYEDEDLKRILDIVFLKKKGYKISKIACMCDKKLSAEVCKYTDIRRGGDDIVDTLIYASFSLDEYKFDSIVEHSIETEGVCVTMDKLVYPLLDRLMVMWLTGSVQTVHEKFIIQNLKRKLLCAIDDSFCFIEDEAPRVLMFGEGSNVSELNMLYAHYLLVKQGVSVLDLGIDVNLEDALKGDDIFKSNAIITFYDDKIYNSLPELVERLEKYGSDRQFIVVGIQAYLQHADIPENISIVKYVKNIPDLWATAKA